MLGLTSQKEGRTEGLKCRRDSILEILTWKFQNMSTTGRQYFSVLVQDLPDAGFYLSGPAQLKRNTGSIFTSHDSGVCLFLSCQLLHWFKNNFMVFNFLH